ncbi:MAG: NUDIX domain-containing protein [Planctomycetaceae bacterium]|nr:NUDIX domain-containing protein [Planctomycetaceae bacterium]
MKRPDTEEAATRKSGTSIIFFNERGEILLFLRDDKDSIPYPDCWDLLGGRVKPQESPRDCIEREMKEEIEYFLEKPELYKESDFDDRKEFTYWKEVNKAAFDAYNRPLHEGQRLQWFSKDEIERLPPESIAFGFRELLLEFLNSL